MSLGNPNDTIRSALRMEPGSYRDRTGRVFYESGVVYRALSSAALEDWEALSRKEFFGHFVAERKLVRTEQVAAPEELLESLADHGERGHNPPLASHWVGVLRHERIPWISYPYEWSFSMLQDAALLHLELLAAAIEEDVTIKDGTAYNVQWQGTIPTFIDIPSFQALAPGEPWVGYRQFCQTFLYPLFLTAYKNVPFHQWLRGSLDGIEADQCNRLMSAFDLFRAGVFAHVYLHAKLQKGYAATETSVRKALPRVGFTKSMILANITQLTRIVRNLRWSAVESTWSEYATSNSYTAPDRDRKEKFVRDVVHARRRELVWDLGCNTGQFSRIAAENSDYVVAMDSDHLAVERLYRSLRQEGRGAILPLLANVVDASPNQGWRGRERQGLTERGTPDLTLCLALIHHIVIGANVPLGEFIGWLSGLNSELIIEFVTKDDPMVKTLLLNKPDHYTDYELDVFERLLEDSFEVVSREPLQSGTRILFFATPRRSG